MAGVNQHIVELGRKSQVIVNYVLKDVDQTAATATRDGADGWTALEVLGHMVDWELVLQERIGQILSGKGDSLKQFDPAWPQTHNYLDQDFAEKLAEWNALRQDSLTLLTNIDDADWEKRGVHATRGVLSVLDLANGIVTHDVDHLEQALRVLGREQARL